MFPPVSCHFSRRFAPSPLHTTLPSIMCIRSIRCAKRHHEVDGPPVRLALNFRTNLLFRVSIYLFPFYFLACFLSLFAIRLRGEFFFSTPANETLTRIFEMLSRELLAGCRSNLKDDFHLQSSIYNMFLIPWLFNFGILFLFYY